MKLTIQLNKEQNTIRLLSNNKEVNINSVELSEHDFLVTSCKINNHLSSIIKLSSNKASIKSKNINIKCNKLRIKSNRKIKIKKDCFHFSVGQSDVNFYFNNVKIKSKKYILKSCSIKFFV